MLGTGVPEMISTSQIISLDRFSPHPAMRNGLEFIREVLDASNACVKKYPDSSPVTGVWARLHNARTDTIRKSLLTNTTEDRFISVETHESRTH